MRLPFLLFITVYITTRVYTVMGWAHLTAPTDMHNGVPHGGAKGLFVVPSSCI